MTPPDSAAAVVVIASVLMFLKFLKYHDDPPALLWDLPFIGSDSDE